MKETLLLIQSSIRENIDIQQYFLADSKSIELVQKITIGIIDAIRGGNKVIFAGNGGSHADSLHLTAEFVNKFMFNRRAIPSITLGSNHSVVTAISNDYSFDNIFSRELEAIGREGDILIALSTSGNSENILNLIGTANSMNIKVYGMTGGFSGKMSQICECIEIPSKITPRIQEAHIMIGHIICELKGGTHVQTGELTHEFK